MVDLPSPGPVGRSGAGNGVIMADAGPGFALRIFDAGLACCAVEVVAAMRRLVPDSADAGKATPAGPADARGEADQPVNVLVVAGTVTDKLAPWVLRAYQEMPAPVRVISFGACSNSGGPYWDSYCVTKGVDQFVPVDLYVPGCPPRPEALLGGLRMLAGAS